MTLALLVGMNDSTQGLEEKGNIMSKIITTHNPSRPCGFGVHRHSTRESWTVESPHFVRECYSAAEVARAVADAEATEREQQILSQSGCGCGDIS
jgi:hypothetical protein